MTEFRAPEVSDKKWIMDLSARSNLHAADFSYGTIFCWGDSIHPEVARLDDRLLVRVRIRDTYMYDYPVGEGDIMPAVYAEMEDAERQSVKFTMRGITRDVLPEVEEMFPEKPKISTMASFSDYVYLAENLASLSGRSLHSKKNHVNRFMAENSWSFEPVTQENIGECREMADRWFASAEEVKNSDFTGEKNAIRRTFDNFFDMEFDGGIIRSGGDIVAFTMGEVISPDTMVTHFEKALAEVNGAYAIINQQFARYMLDKYPGLVYINREEDMGIEGLRKAKQSYHPVFMVDKYSAVWDE